MLVTVSDKMEFKSVPASEAWELYSTFTHLRVAHRLSPEMFDRYEVVEDNKGKAGTVILVYFKPDKHSPATPVKEIFAVVDDEKRVKVVECPEGFFMDFLLSMKTFYKLTEKPKKEGEEEEESCILEYGIEYDAKDLAVATAMMNTMPRLELINKRIGEYLITNRKNKST